MSSVKLRKVGGSISAAIPPHILEALSLSAGSELNVDVDHGRIVLSPVVVQGRIGLAARLARCELTTPRTKAEQAELDAWHNAKPVGRERL
jgi:antitoxin ChpS